MTYYEEEDKPLTEKERSEIVMKVSFQPRSLDLSAYRPHQQ